MGCIDNAGASVLSAAASQSLSPGFETELATAAAMASCYEQTSSESNPYTRWLQSNASLDYYTGMQTEMAFKCSREASSWLIDSLDWGRVSAVIYSQNQ